MSEVIIDNEKCIVCCECINVCREEVIGMEKGEVKVLKPELCSYCEDCSDICEQFAIEVLCDCEM